MQAVAPPPAPPEGVLAVGDEIQHGNGPTWRVEGYLAHGNFGTVYAVCHQTADGDVVRAALKKFNEVADTSRPAFRDLHGFYYTHGLTGFPELLDPIGPNGPAPPNRFKTNPFLVCTLLGPSLAHAPPGVSDAAALGLRLLATMRSLHENKEYDQSSGLVYKARAAPPHRTPLPA